MYLIKIACALLVVLCAPFVLADKIEGKKARYYDLPALPLNQALIEFALQSGTFIAVNDSLVRGHQSVPLVGPFYPEKALALLIAKANLIALYDQSQASFVLLEKSSSRLAILPETPKNTALEEVVVTGNRLPARYPNAVNSFVRGGVSQFDSVRFHQFLNPAFIRDVAALSIGEALAYSSGVTPGDGIGSSNDDFFCVVSLAMVCTVKTLNTVIKQRSKLHQRRLNHYRLLRGLHRCFMGKVMLVA